MKQLELAGLFSDLVRFETELWDVIDKKLRDIHQLPLTHFEPMQVISRTPRCRVNDISEALSITVGGTSKLVDRIQASGLCRREVDPLDRRSSQIELTELGRQRLAEANQTFVEELQRNIGSTLSHDCLHQFAATIRQLRDGLK